MGFLLNKEGTSTIEWLVVTLLIVAVVGGTLLGVFYTLRDKLEAVRDAL